MSEKIINALKSLDTGNDNHWTADGRPRLETVKMLAADQSITREAVDAAAAGFTRANPVVTGVDAEGKPATQGEATKTPDGGVDIPGARDIEANGELAGVDADGKLSGHTDQEARELGLERPASEEQPETGDLSITPPEPAPGQTDTPTERTPANGQDPTSNPAPATEGHATPRDPGAPEASDGGDTGTDEEAEQSEVEAGPQADADAIVSLEQELEDEERQLEKLNGYKDEINAQIADVQRRADSIRDDLTSARGSSDNGTAIVGYLEAQKRQSEERGQQRQALASAGVDIGALLKATAKSPIDAAMARKTDRSAQRPSG